MSTSKVSKYNKHNDIIISNISISYSLNPPTVSPNILQDDYNGKMSLITESVAVTRIDIHPIGEESDQHAIRLTPGGSHV
jgi:hypothetical protein